MAQGIHNLHILTGEVNHIITDIRRTPRDRWNANQDDRNQLLEKVITLKQLLNTAEDLEYIDAKTFLLPFLDIIRADDTSAIVTTLALETVQKILNYKMLDSRSKAEVSSVVNQIAEAITHARFTGSDPSSDEAVLMTLIDVLRTLVLSQPGNLLTNEVLCEIAGSLFRMSLEPRLTALLRKVSDKFLVEIIQHLFTRIPELAEGSRDVKRTVKKIHRALKRRAPNPPVTATEPEAVATAPDSIVPESGVLSYPESPVQFSTPEVSPLSLDSLASTDSNSHERTSEPVLAASEIYSLDIRSPPVEIDTVEGAKVSSHWSPAEAMTVPTSGGESNEEEEEDEVHEKEMSDKFSLVPYGLPAIHEIFRFIITLISPTDKNADLNLNLGLSLLTTAIEVSGASLPKYHTMIVLVRDDLCRNLNFLIQSEKLSIFTLALRLGFFVFGSMRSHLKLQLERFMTILMEVISTELIRSTQEHKEAALDTILSFFRLSDFVTELYLNYDCDLHCSNLFEDLTKLLSKNAFPVSGLNAVHLLSLDCLLMAIDKIEKNCKKVVERPEIFANVVNYQEERGKLQLLKHRKRVLVEGTSRFNKNPKDGLLFLQQNGELGGKSADQLDPIEVAKFLRENHILDKTMIGEYISKRNHGAILEAYVKSFDFTGRRIDEALREYLETFRLPGEAPLISNLLEHFAAHWHESNGSPFNNPDAAFTLSYAIIMLNTDQHNQNAKKQNVPMSINDFKKNLSGINKGKDPGSGKDLGPDFNPDLLEEIYEAIRKEEIIMPAERTGLVRDLYLWKILLRRAERHSYLSGAPTGVFDVDLFCLLWGPTIAALSYAFDKTADDFVIRKTVNGFKNCAAIAASPSVMSCEVFDNIVVTLCKFSTLQNVYESPSSFSVTFGQNTKAQLATKTVFRLAYQHGDILRDGWKNIVEGIVQLFRARLLPEHLNEGKDFVNGIVALMREEQPQPRQEAGIFNAFYNFITSDSSSKSTVTLQEETTCKKMARDCIDECEIPLLVSDSRFLQSESLREFLNALMNASRFGKKEGETGSGITAAEEHSATICLELLVRILIENRDRIGEQGMSLWPVIHDYFYTLLLQENRSELSFLTERAVVGLLRLAVRFLPRPEKELQKDVMRSLRLLLGLRVPFFNRLSRQICFALTELFKPNVTENIKSKDDWTLLFTLLECSGAGVRPSIQVAKEMVKSESQQISPTLPEVEHDRGYTSDSELYDNNSLSPAASSTWLMIGKEGEVMETGSGIEADLSMRLEFYHHDKQAFLRAIEIFKEILDKRFSGIQINLENIQAMFHCLCVLAECSMNGVIGIQQRVHASALKRADKKLQQKLMDKRSHPKGKTTSSPVSPSEQETQLAADDYLEASQVILKLMEDLHERAVAELGRHYPRVSLWSLFGCSLLRSMARVCCDGRKNVRSFALPILQRALSNKDFQKFMSPGDWEECLHKVLFPLLLNLKSDINPQDRSAVEDTRMRAFPILCKVFLQHLAPLMSLPSFGQTWMSMLDHLALYAKPDRSDQLREAVLESIKNILLVMSTAGVFENYQGPLWEATREKVESIAPGLTQHLIETTTSPRLERQTLTRPSSSSSDVLPDPVSFQVLNSSPPRDPPGLPLLLDPGMIQGMQFPVLSSARENAKTLSPTESAGEKSSSSEDVLPSS